MIANDAWDTQPLPKLPGPPPPGPLVLTAQAEGLLGMRLGGYRLEACIGKGGMAWVFRASSRSGSAACVKVLRHTLLEDPRMIARFRREARLMAAARHPNLVKLHYQGMTRLPAYGEPMVPFLVMELIDGESLARLLSRTGLPPIPDALRIGSQIARALAALHAAGIVHRDLKPKNILLQSPHAFVKVVDLGVGRFVAEPRDAFSGTNPGCLVGSPSYMSPEQVLGANLDARVDLYALGVVLYEMLTGEPPFDGETRYDVLRAQVHGAPRPLRQTRSDVPAPLERLVLQLMSKDPARRPPNATLIAEHLTALRR